MANAQHVSMPWTNGAKDTWTDDQNYLSVDLRWLQRLYTIYIEFVMSIVSTVLALS